jgi:hypothetical protein
MSCFIPPKTNIISNGFIFVNTFLKNFKRSAHNVPAVYDVLAARIKKCAAFLGLAKCGWSEPWEGAQRLT